MEVTRAACTRATKHCMEEVVILARESSGKINGERGEGKEGLSGVCGRSGAGV